MLRALFFRIVLNNLRVKHEICIYYDLRPFKLPFMSKQTKRNQVSKPTKPAISTQNPAPTVVQRDTQRWRLAGLLALFAFLLYSNTFGFDYVLDDPLVITLNQYVQAGFGGLYDIFTHSYRAGSSVATDSEYLYRPLSVASFAIEWAIAPNSPGFYHFMNVLWYACTIGLVFLCLSKIMPNRPLVLFALATALFAAHPLHTEVVANIKSRDELMSFFFSVLSLYWFWDYTKSQQKQRLILALSAFFLALLSKEGAVTMLVLIPISLYFLDSKRSITDTLSKSSWLLIPFFLWFLLRWSVMHGRMGYTPDFNDNQLVAAGLLDRWATGFVLLGKYLQLLVWPAVLSWDYSFNQIPTVSWSSPICLLAFGVHLGLLGYALWNFKKRSIFSYLILAYFASIALYANIFMLIGTVAGERLAYSASLWFALGVSLLIWKLLRIPDEKVDAAASIFATKNVATFTSILVVLIFAASYRTFVRTPVWKDSNTLFINDKDSAPNSFRSTRAAGEQYFLQYLKSPTAPGADKLLEQARVFFDKSYAIRPTENAVIGLGNVDFFRKNYPAAATKFKQALELKPNNKLATDRLLATYIDWGKYEGQINKDYEASTACMLEGLKLYPKNQVLLRQLGTAYGLQNKHREAIYYYEMALEQAPGDKEIIQNLAIGYRLLGDMTKSDYFTRQLGQ